MKIAALFLATCMASVQAFAPVASPRSMTVSLSMTPEEDMELTRKVIQDFEKAQNGEAPVEEEETEAAKEEVAAE